MVQRVPDWGQGHQEGQEAQGPAVHLEHGESEASWSPVQLGSPFQQIPAPLQKFVDYLAEHNVVTFDVACHQVKVEPDKMTVQEVEGCAFEPKKLPGRTVADLTNCGSLMPFPSVDWELCGEGNK